MPAVNEYSDRSQMAFYWAADVALTGATTYADLTDTTNGLVREDNIIGHVRTVSPFGFSTANNTFEILNERFLRSVTGPSEPNEITVECAYRPDDTNMEALIASTIIGQKGAIAMIIRTGTNNSSIIYQNMRYGGFEFDTGSETALVTFTFQPESEPWTEHQA